MAAYSFSTDFNVGGLASIQIAPVYGFLSLNPVAFIAGYNWDDIEAKPESAYLEDEQVQDANGMVYSYTLSLVINKKNTALEDMIKRYAGITSIFKLTDNNGLQCIVGTLDTPMALKTTATTGKRYTDENHYLLQWHVSLPQPVVYF